MKKTLRIKNKTNLFCVVGYGKHAKTKLIPSILINKKNKIEVVSSKTLNLSKIKVHKNLNKALKEVKPSTIFIIATPPEAHFVQTEKILKSGHNVFVEKPIVTSLNDAKKLSNLVKSSNHHVTEILMYKYSNLYERFLTYWNKKRHKILFINCVFYIPALPVNTFRDHKNVSDSIVYDIGCYLVSLLVDLNLEFKSYSFKNIIFEEGRLKSLEFKINNDNVIFNGKFGLDKNYENSITLSKKNSKIKFSPFFYGVKSKKNIEFTNEKKSKCIEIDDINAFETVFSKSDDFWKDKNNQSLDKIIEVNKILEKISSVVFKERYTNE